MQRIPPMTAPIEQAASALKIPMRKTPGYHRVGDGWEKCYAFIADIEEYDPVAAELFNIDALNLYLRIIDTVNRLRANTAQFKAERDRDRSKLTAKLKGEYITGKTPPNHISDLVKGNHDVIDISKDVDTCKVTLEYLEKYQNTLMEIVWYLRKELERLNPNVH
jgi:hypothetical protein